MKVATPPEYGRFLGFSLGIDGPASAIFPRSMEELMNETISGVSQYVERDASSEESSSYGEQFASLFLPSFVRTFVDIQDEAGPATFCIGLFQNLCTTSSTARFIREHPREALKLYIALAHALDFLSKGAEAVLDAGIGGAVKICNFIATLTFFVIELATQLPSSYTLLPPLSAPTKAGLHRLLVMVQEDPRFIRSSHELGHLVLEEAIDGRDLGLFRQVVDENGVRRAWFDCEHTQGSPQTSCFKLELGEEMMACSRCLAVRYCSKEHQKADWKRHKPVCFKPSW